ncbi:ExbD/TolR family protein [Pseudobacter ginsenosidimutans]|uniref:Outer membrane transport energization protein ExbD n=1 Tax=Pseudobacter ginsenosidimutans TaxID=661488 RepID=A0A4Q7MHC0_9BACT|nr:biopolymer transporter ExbD [Pseudobacter ginsenosidimutans]QEC45546.1 biopolymer transporter ExbD [Pseudobacter ginsenosidimutans]RZS67087.1 outer membrane transport energization protein ExbD [Pseudobacter ginsenosidimutans]
MNLRRRLRSHQELHAGALNDILFILLFFFLIVSTIANPNIVKVNNPKGTKDTKAKQHITVSIDKNQNYYLGTKLIDPMLIDTMVKAEILKFKTHVDTPVVVINADTSAYFGEVFRIMRLATRAGAKTVANVK